MKSVGRGTAAFLGVKLYVHLSLSIPSNVVLVEEPPDQCNIEFNAVAI